MSFLRAATDMLGSAVTPFMLIFTAAVLMFSTKREKKQEKTTAHVGFFSKNSPVRALTLALAGTLGVGNITGVTSALISGGPGAVFWMWAGSVIVIIIKYAEVYLSVLYRQRDRYGFFGGAMYYIRDGLSKRFGGRASAFFGSVFAVLCIANSLFTGNIVQSSAASSALSPKHRIVTGAILAVLVLFSIIFGTRRIERITAYLIPPLAGVYIAISAYVIFSNLSLAGEVFCDIFSSAFSYRAVLGGAAGFCMRDAVRYGIMRGIFSNEAGCGTSPTAHASAETESPSAQGRLGIAEVVFDTPVLCTLTALVMLIADKKYALIPWNTSSDAASVTLSAFGMIGGFREILSVSIILFAYATIIAQIYYGTVAIGYLSQKKKWRVVYYILSVVCTVIGSVVSSELMWMGADALLGTMTVLNCLALLFLRRECRL